MKLKNLVSCGLVLVGLFSVFHSALAYDEKTTHPALTNEIVSFYNLTHPDAKITDEERGWIIEGSRFEDTPPRWINHFYDPIHKTGWSGSGEGDIPASAVQIISQFGLSQDKPLSAVQWANDDLQQGDYSRYEGDRTWKRALNEYVVGNKRESYIALGHVLHLLEDMAVPDHTRNDTHAALPGIDNGSPYESYATRFTITGIKQLNIAKKLVDEKASAIQKSSIEESLVSLATYSNNYFFSKDTINAVSFSLPKIVSDDGNFGYGKDENGHKFPLVKVRRINTNNHKYKNVYQLDGVQSAIFNSYFSHLSRKSILYGAGVINLFYGSIENTRIAKEFPTHIYKLDMSVFRTPVVSMYGEAVKVKNYVATSFITAKNFLSGFAGVVFNTNPSDVSKSVMVEESYNNIDTAPLSTGIVSSEDTQQMVDEESETPSVDPQIADVNDELMVNEDVVPVVASRVMTATSGQGINNSVVTSTVLLQQNAVQSTQSSLSPPSGGTVSSVSEPSKPSCVSGGVKISEFMYDAPGSDDGREWIEILNSGNEVATISEMKLVEGGSNHSIKSERGAAVLQPGAYAIISNDAKRFISDNSGYLGHVFNASFSLSNDGERIVIKCGNDTVDDMEYSSSTGARGDGNSLQLVDGVWRASSPTIGIENKYNSPIEAKLPEALFTYFPKNPKVGEIVQFDASSSTDDRQLVSYGWIFGDGTAVNSANPFVLHPFGSKGIHPVSLIVTNSEGVTSTVQFMDVPVGLEDVDNKSGVVISEIQVGGQKADDEFIELYNPTDSLISLRDHSLQYLSGVATSTDWIKDRSVKKNFEDAQILPHRFYLLVNSDATSSLRDRADVIYSNFSLSGDSRGATIFLVSTTSYILGIEDPHIVNSVSYGDINLEGVSTAPRPASKKSLERKATFDSTSESMSNGSDEFLGNGYVSNDSKNDFVVRLTSNPQNFQSYPEPRMAPTVPLGSDGTTSTIAEYSSSTNSISFKWEPSTDFCDGNSGIVYELYRITSTSTALIATVAGTSYGMNSVEAGYIYSFGLRARDVDGLRSATSSFSIDAPLPENVIPKASFIYSPNNPNASDQVYFDGAPSSDSDGSIVGYQWDFGDGTTASSTNATTTHAFDAVGDYIVVLTITDDRGATSIATSSISVPSRAPSSLVYSQEDFSGGEVNMYYQANDVVQYLGTDMKGTFSKAKIYYSSCCGYYPTQKMVIYESDSYSGAPRVKVVEASAMILGTGWQTFVGPAYTFSPSKHYWLVAPAGYSAYPLHPAKGVLNTPLSIDYKPFAFNGDYMTPLDFPSGEDTKKFFHDPADGKMAYQITTTL